MTNDTLEYDFDDEYWEKQQDERCEKCNRDYDDIDFDYQICSKCGWDKEAQKYGKTRKPTDIDYTNGDADILTGQWT